MLLIYPVDHVLTPNRGLSSSLRLRFGASLYEILKPPAKAKRRLTCRHSIFSPYGSSALLPPLLSSLDSLSSPITDAANTSPRSRTPADLPGDSAAAAAEEEEVEVEEKEEEESLSLRRGEGRAR